MPDEINSATLTPPAEEGSFEAWEATQKEAAPAQQPKAEEKAAVPSVPKGETAAATEAAPAQEQKPKQQLQQPKRKHDAESRIDELTRKLKERDQELEGLRKNRESQVSQPAPESRQPVSEPARLGKLSEYVRAEHLKRPDVLQEDLIEEWVQRRDAEAEQLRQVRATGERINKAMSDFREKNPDVADAVFNELTLGTPQVNLMRPLMENIPNWTDVLHYLHENRDVYDRVQRSSPQEQWHAVSSIAWNLSNGLVSVAKSAGQPAQEQPRSNVRPISRVPAPAKHVLGGGMPPEGKTLRDARDFEEAEAIEKRRTAGGR